MKKLAVLIPMIILLTVSSEAQVSAVDLSYFPLHIGNTWTYKKSIDHGPGPVFTGYSSITVAKDTLYANGKRYYRYFGRDYRIDTLTGIVYRIRFQPMPSLCSDSLEEEIVNVTINSMVNYQGCSGSLGSVYPNIERVGLLNITRHTRNWELGFISIYKYAQGIGLCYSGEVGNGGGWETWELVYAEINGQTYWPVEFRTFAARYVTDMAVLLEWSTVNEVNNSGFHVQRRSAGEEPWHPIGFVEAHPSHDGSGEYRFIDSEPGRRGGVKNGETLFYRLAQQDYDGTISYSHIVEAELVQLPGSPMLSLYPNPALGLVSIHWNYIADGDVSVRVFDSLARLVWERETVGNLHEVVWTCVRSDGTPVPPGLYIVQVTDGMKINVGKMVVM